MDNKLNFAFEDLDNKLNFTSCNDLCDSGIPRFGISPLLNATHIYYTSNHLLHGLNYVSVDSDVDFYVISACVNHSPDDWTGFNPKVKSLFSYLNKKYLNDLRKGNALLLLDQSFEGYQTSWLWDWFHSECLEWGVNPMQIVYVTGNMIADEIYDVWCIKNKIQDRIKIIPYSHFELDMAVSVLNKQSGEIPTFADHVTYKKKHLNDIKTFACLNKRVRLQRVWFYNYLFQANLLEKGLVSMNYFDDGPNMFEGKKMDESLWGVVNKDLPRLVYGKPNNELDDNYYINRFPTQFCLDTFFTVVSEAHCGDSDQTMFLSEKTFKVIACNHPFMITGNKDSMRMMRNLGYKTFDGLIDEGYDSLPTHERMQYIIESIKKVDNIQNKLDWFELTKDIVEHNYKTMMDKTRRVPDALIELKKYYNSLNKKLI